MTWWIDNESEKKGQAGTRPIWATNKEQTKSRLLIGEMDCHE